MSVSSVLITSYYSHQKCCSHTVHTNHSNQVCTEPHFRFHTAFSQFSNFSNRTGTIFDLILCHNDLIFCHLVAHTANPFFCCLIAFQAIQFYPSFGKESLHQFFSQRILLKVLMEDAVLLLIIEKNLLPEAYLVSRAGFSVIGQRIFKAESSHRRQLWFLNKRKSFLWSPQMLSGQIGSGLCQECVPF